MFGWNFFLVKGPDGDIKAFHNICRHRGHPVVTKTYGTTSFLTCKFHGWSYKTDGSLYKAREYDGLPDFDRAEHSLFRIHTHVTSQGFIFVNFDARDKPAVSFEDQFGDDFDPLPKAATGKIVGDEFSLFAKDEYEYDHTWNSSVAGTKYNWKTFVDGFQECYHCPTGHPTTLLKDFCLKDYYLRQGHGASRHFLPPARDDLSEAYITWLYPLGLVTFSENLLFIGRFNAKGALDTSYDSETYRRTRIPKPSPKYDEWMGHEIAYWRLVETEDVELAVDAQKGFMNGVLGKGRLHPTQGELTCSNAVLPLTLDRACREMVPRQG
jgi:phenylpropionate dioxygenase-like ring-hydroxylating dioxygenase large terminal subunit